jgi:hypothetical protein
MFKTQSWCSNRLLPVDMSLPTVLLYSFETPMFWQD